MATTATDGGLGEPPGRGGSTLDKRLLLSLLASAAHLNAGENAMGSRLGMEGAGRGQEPWEHPQGSLSSAPQLVGDASCRL